MDKKIAVIGKPNIGRPKILTDLASKIKISKAIGKVAAGVSKENYPHMPKYHRCPHCLSPSRRSSRTVTGANYRCRAHGNFLVVFDKAINSVV